MVEHERTHGNTHTTSDTATSDPTEQHTAVPDVSTTDTDPIPVQRPVAEPTGATPRVEQAYRNARHASGWWARMSIAALVLIVLLVFIVENLGTVDIAFFGAHGHLPLGVAMLVAAVCGVLLVLIPSFGRILHLRRTLRRATTGK